jgi:predicted kinase
MRIFVMMVGMPGSGKTWLRQKAFYDAKVICPDDRIGYTKDRPWTPRAAEAAWRDADDKFDAALRDEGIDLIVFDATNVSAKRRRKYMTRAAKAGMQTVAVYCHASKDTCLTRNAARTEHRQVPTAVIDRMCGNLEPPTLEEGFNLVARIDPLEGIHSFHESTDCECGDEIRERFKFLWGDAQHKTVTVVKE